MTDQRVSHSVAFSIYLTFINSVNLLIFFFQQTFLKSCLPRQATRESWFWSLVPAPAQETWGSYAGLEHGTEFSQTSVSLHRDVPGMPIQGCPSKKKNPQSSRAWNAQESTMFICTWHLCLGLETETQLNRRTFLSKGTWHSTNWWGCLATLTKSWK